MKFSFRFSSVARLALGFVVLSVLVSCSSAPVKPQPVELAPNAGLLGVRLAWTSKVGAINFPLDVKVVGDTVLVASSDGWVMSLDARTGAQQWRTSVGGQIAAGVGSDGRFAAVITRNNEMVTLDGGREIWRQKLPAQSFTAPLVAGERIFVLAADRSATAFDAQSGRKLWVQQRAGESLVLRQAGLVQSKVPCVALTQPTVA